MNQFCDQCGSPIAAGNRSCGACGATYTPVKTDTGFSRMRVLFDAAVALPPEEREPWLERACQGNTALLAQIKGMLAAENASMFQEPAGRVGPSTIIPPGGGSREFVGPYRLVRELGRGGMGVVYLAMRDDGAFRKNVALKVLLKERVNDEFVLRFRQERHLLAALDHPNIARILDGGDTSTGMPYYVMEYVEGMPIEQYCDQERLSLGDRIRLFLQVCHAVHYLHEHMIIHRDLKPSNVLVSHEGAVKLVDFGIAKFLAPVSLSSGQDLTGVQGQPLTPNYASPEQIAGGQAQKTADIYSLGVILYRLLTGRLPYQGLEDRMAQVQSRLEPPLPSHNIREDLRNTPETTAQLRRRMMGDLDQIVLMAMRFDPRERYQTAAEFAEDLQKFLDGRTVSARKASLASRSMRLLRRKRVAAAVIVGFLSLGSISGWQWVRIARHNSEMAAMTASANDFKKLMDSLDSHVLRSGQASKPEDRTKDVRVFREALEKGLGPMIAKHPELTPERKALFQRSSDYLAKVRPFALQNVELTVELAAAYQQLGIMQERSNSGKSEVVQSYSAGVQLLRQVPAGAYAQVAGTRLDLMLKRIVALGGTPPEIIIATITPVTNGQGKPPRRIVASEGDDSAERVQTPDPAPSADQLRQIDEHLTTVESKVRIAEQSLAPIIADLATTGQKLNANTASDMARMKAMLAKARRDAASNNFAAAHESLDIADALAGRVLKTVGR